MIFSQLDDHIWGLPSISNQMTHSVNWNPSQYKDDDLPVYRLYIKWELLYQERRFCIDLLHNSHNAPVPYPIMHHFVTEMCTCVHISVTKWCIVGYLCDALWDLWDWSIDTGPRYLRLIYPDQSLISAQLMVYISSIKNIWVRELRLQALFQ